eukprot:TRINITY_DN1823_c0_g1_i1.p1 TRINITY_DN1823_c0_g1~~TRINITY_DN1823_c0_g1_i1.p1  ORF type:complete len:102 (+),score=17.04 TRINITY_DN1823_c0_g1_i1:48-308(+)
MAPKAKQPEASGLKFLLKVLGVPVKVCGLFVLLLFVQVFIGSTLCAIEATEGYIFAVEGDPMQIAMDLMEKCTAEMHPGIGPWILW